jgi:hypothetical protein
MRQSRWWTALLVAAAFAGGENTVFGQGVTTGAITGTVTDLSGQPVSEAEVVVTNRATGYTNSALTRSTGLYLVQGLEVGSNYTVLVRRIGFEQQERTNVVVTLGQATRVDFQVREQAVQLGQLEATATRTEVFSPTRQGVGTTVTDTMLRRVPNLTRDYMDLVKLTPQVTRPQDGGPSAGGQYNRFNTFTIDGANQSDKFNLSSSGGTPGTASGSKTISVEAIKEFRVHLSPTDVRQGNFTGMLVNAVTKSGTNDWTGGATYTYRDESLADTLTQKSPLNVQQYSFQLGGPIIRDRLHFFIAPEFQRRERPATGPFIGSSDMNISPDSIARVVRAANDSAGLGFDPGSAAAFTLENPTMNLFGRVDFAINDQHRAVFRQIYNKATDDDFSRNLSGFNTSPLTQTSGFRLSSNMNQREHTNLSSVLQLFSNFANGWSNEVLVGYNRLRDERLVPQQAPEMSVAVVPIGSATPTPTAAITFGTEQFSPNNLLKQNIIEVTENLTIPLGAHTVTVGGRIENTKMFNNFAQRSYGVWIFPSITAFASRAPSGYAFSYANSQDPADIPVDFGVQLFSIYAQDQWSVNPRLTVTAGIRGDMPRFQDEPSRNDTIAAVWDTVPGSPGELNTALVPKSRMMLSPRIGFNFDVFGNQSTQLRGNVGVFTGSPPYILLGNAFQNTGLGLVTLSCTGGDVPAFTTDVSDLPTSCLNRPEPLPNVSGTAGINTNDPDFKYPQSFTASAGFDQRLPGDVVMTVEGMYRKAINGLLIRDRNLRGPRMVGAARYTDVHGRVLYADTFSATHGVTNTGQRYITTVRGVNFAEGIVEVTNQSEDYNYTISGQLSKRFSPSLQTQVSYTYMQAKDVQSLTSDRAISNFRNGQQLATAHSDLEVGTSYFERPHRLVIAGTFTAPWKSTDVSLFYEGQSGTPMTYVYSGDINGDGINANDPIYVPNDATNTSEIRIGTQTLVLGIPVFTQNLATAERFNEFIDAQECLDEQRGSIMERNSCSSPWQNRMDLSIRQAVPDFEFLRGHGLALQLDIFNVLGMLNEDWGRLELPTLSSNFPQQSVLVSTGRTPGPINQSLPVVTFAPTVANITGDEPLIFSKGTSAANFYQMQLTLRWSF